MKHKSLHESAAEILAASVAGAGKEPLPMTDMLMNPPADLGGATTMAEPTSVGDAASQSAAMSPKPGKTGAPAEDMKKVEQDSEDSEEEDTEEESPEAMMESLIAEHGEQVILENLITEHGDTVVFSTIMEEYVNQHGAELVQEAFVETLIEEIGEENTIDILVECIVADFNQQEISDEELNTLKEQSEAFVSELDVLSEEDFDNYMSSLDEEQLIYAIQLASLNEGFLSKVGKFLKKGVKAVGKVVAKAAPVLSFIPGVGTALGAVAGKVLGGIGSKIAGSALGKAVSAGVSKLGSSVVGQGLLNAGKGALTGGVSSVLQGGKFSQGAKLGAISGVASPLVNKVAGGLSKVTGSETLGQTAADALAGGVASKALGGSFGQGAKTGAIGSVVGRVAGGIGDAIRQRSGSDTAGDLARDVATTAADRSMNRPKRAAVDQEYDQNDQEDESDTEQPTSVSRKSHQEPEENPDSPRNFMRDVASNKVKMRQARAQRGININEESDKFDEIFNELSTLNEEQLEQFVSMLSEEEIQLLEAAGKSIVPVSPVMKNVGARAAKISAAEKAGATTGVIVSKGASKAAGVGKKLLSGAKGVLGKVAAPVAAGMAAYDAKQGWNVDPNASTGKKALNALQSAASGATLGLIPEPTAAAAEKRSAVQGKDQLAGYDKYGRPAGSKNYGVAPGAAAKPMPASKKSTPSASTAGMSDEQRYGKTGAAIRAADKDAYAKRKDSAYLKSMGITAAPGSADANIQLLNRLKGGKPAGASAATTAATTAAAAPTAPAATPAADVTPTQAVTPARQSVSAGGQSDWDKLSTWEANPIERVGGGNGRQSARYSQQDYNDYNDYSDYEGTPEKAGVGIFRTPTGEKTALRRAIPNEIADIVGGLTGGIGQAFKIKELGYKKPGSRVYEQIEESNMNVDNGEETTMETTELTEEQIREQRMLAIKEAVKQFKGNMREDVDALFNGESLSEEFRAKATLIFESAVSSRVESILEQVMEQNDAVLSEAYDEIKNQLTEQVDEYLNYVVEQWMTDNQVAIETGLRAELAEDFISGLRALFQEHYIEIPEEKVDVAETLATELEQASEYVDTVHQHIEAQDATIAGLQEQLNAVKKEKFIDNFCEGLTLVQAEKMKALAEGVEFTTEGDFEEKLAVLRENYFPTKVQVKSEVKELQKAALNEEPEVAKTNNIMERYVKTISKTAPKA